MQHRREAGRVSVRQASKHVSRRPAVVTNRRPGVVPVHEDRRLAARPHSGRHPDGEVQLYRQPMQSDQRLSLPRGTRGAPGCLHRKRRTNDVPKRDVHGGLCLHHQ